MTLRILKNAVVFDGHNEELLEGASVVIEGDRIREVATGAVALNGADEIDLQGKFLMPGLLDLSLFQKPEKMPLIMRGGELKRNLL